MNEDDKITYLEKQIQRIFIEIKKLKNNISEINNRLDCNYEDIGVLLDFLRKNFPEQTI